MQFTSQSSAGSDHAAELPMDSTRSRVEPAEAMGRVRKISSYDLPTPEKRAFGERLRRARELAGLQQAEAAEQMGYSQAVQLSNMENGNRMPPLHVLMRAAVIYGTTVDYLCGLAEDPDPDPVAVAQREVATRVSAQVRRMVESLLAEEAEHRRSNRLDIAAVSALARLVLEANGALASLRVRNPLFDDSILGGATLLAKLRMAAESAGELDSVCERLRRREHLVADTQAFVHDDLAHLPWELMLRPVPKLKPEQSESDQEDEMHLGHA